MTPADLKVRQGQSLKNPKCIRSLGFSLGAPSRALSALRMPTRIYQGIGKGVSQGCRAKAG